MLCPLTLPQCIYLWGINPIYDTNHIPASTLSNYEQSQCQKHCNRIIPSNYFRWLLKFATALSEAKILHRLSSHKNIVTLKETFYNVEVKPLLLLFLK